MAWYDCTMSYGVVAALVKLHFYDHGNQLYFSQIFPDGHFEHLNRIIE